MPMFPNGEHWTNPIACTVCGKPVVVDCPTCRYCGQVHVDVHCSREHEQMGGLQASLEDYRAGLANQVREHGERSARVGDPAGFSESIRAIRDAAQIHDTFSADDVVWPGRGNELGAAFSHLAKAREIVSVGFAISERPNRHGGVRRRWRRT
jgi:hypothetical protein